MKQVIKRNGSIVEYDPSKISNAIWKAVKAVGGNNYNQVIYITRLVENRLDEKYGNIATVEQIQDQVEKTLVKNGHYKTAKTYILYRKQRQDIREASALALNNDLIEKYVSQNDWRINENANMTYSLQGMNFHISSGLVADYWLHRIYPDTIRQCHENGDFHIHDLGILGVYCFTGDTKIPLLNGEEKTLAELAISHKDKSFWVYSIDKNKNIVPGLAHSPRKTRVEAELVEVTLDNNEKIKCTPDHPFLLRNGDYKQASKLQPGESLMPLYLYPGYRNTDYLGVYNPGTNQKYYLHRLISGAKKGESSHHINGDKTNNDPGNIEVMQDSDHRSFELRKTMQTEKWKNAHKKVMTERNQSEPMRAASTKNTIKRNKTVRQRAISSYTHSKGLAIDKESYLSHVTENGYVSAKTYAQRNHKVLSVKKLTYTEDVYDITVDKHHNFALSAGVFVHNCVGWDLLDLLTVGFKGVKGKIASSPPKHFRTALGQLVNFFYTLTGEAAGAQAFSNIDTLLAPFIRYDNLTYEQVKQAMQEFIFNMNVPTRVGFQTPFSNISLDLQVPSYYKDHPVIIGGKYMDKTYGQFQPEMDMFNRVFAEVMTEGDGEGRVFTFPIPTYNITEDFDWDNKAYDKIWEMTAKYGIPYFSNFIGSDMNPEDARSMCCRLRLDKRELRKRGGGLFGANPLTGSIGVVTINMPRLGHYASSKEDFFIRLALMMDISSQCLEVKRKALENFTEQGLYPYSKFYLRAIKQSTGQYWTNHFSTIGLIGMNEACLNLLGKDIGTPEGKGFSAETLTFMRNRLQCYQEKTGNIYNLEATPAEGCSYSLLLNDKKQFEVPHKYYSNSTQLPVNYTDDLFTSLNHQELLQSLYTGGTVFHTFLGEAPPAETAKTLVRKMCQQYKIPYYDLTPTFSICEEHGYLKGKQPICPKCGEETEVFSRVVGYLRPVSQYNPGKKQEMADRKLFKGVV